MKLITNEKKALSWLDRYAMPVFLAIAATALRASLEPWLGERQPFVFFYIAITVSAIYYGLGPALLCLALSLCWSVYFFVSGTYPVDLSPASCFAVATYTCVSGTIAYLALRQRAVRQRAEASEAEVRSLNETLEAKVAERTEELQRANDELAGFTYSIAHDMRQFLRGINIAAHTIIEDQYDSLNAEGRDSLNSLGRNAKAASSLVDGLLEFARLGKDELQFESFDVAFLAKEVRQQLLKLNVNAKITINIQPTMLASGDWRLVKIALHNLIENAIKYRALDRETVIEVACYDMDTERVFYVKDNGIGFDIKFVDRVFKPFERLHKHHEYPGTGIGLANVKRIVDKHGGRIWAESAIGEGSTFYFSLPLPEAPANPNVVNVAA